MWHAPSWFYCRKLIFANFTILIYYCGQRRLHEGLPDVQFQKQKLFWASHDQWNGIGWGTHQIFDFDFFETPYCWCHNWSEPTYSSLDKLAQCRHITFTFYTLQIKSPTNWLNPRPKEPILNLFRLYSLRAISNGLFWESTSELFSSICPRMF